jgi:peptidoglycan/xylan/chitin deacetylase (PgdA/CDA1 family)
MSLPPDYLIYPHRRYGMDQDRYDWQPAPGRPPLKWPNDAKAAVMLVVPIEHHPLDPSATPFKHPGAMVTPYPDLRHYTSRDYGNRVGVFRILEALQAAGILATFPINATALDRFAPLVAAIQAAGHEIAAYGLSTSHIHWGGLDPELERAWVAEVRDRFTAAGLTPRTWLSPARQQSFSTLDLLAEYGFDICLDWESDSRPLPMRTKTSPVIALPLSNELDDRTLLIDRRQSEQEWAGQLREAADCLKAEHASQGGQMLGMTLTPYVSGQPFRTRTMRDALVGFGEDRHLWCSSASAIADAAAL